MSELQNVIMVADKLAAEANISRETTAVTQDKSDPTKHFLVEQVTQYGDSAVPGGGLPVRRRDQYYFIANVSDPDELSNFLMRSKAQATLQFLGRLDVLLNWNAVAEGAPDTRTRKNPAKTAARASSKTPAKAAGKAAAKAAKAQEADAGPDTTPDEPQPVLYNKPDRGHAAFAKAVIEKVIGKDWNKDEAKKEAVKKLVAALHGKVPVTDTDGEVLDSFNAFVEKFLRETYAGGQTEEDVI